MGVGPRHIKLQGERVCLKMVTIIVWFALFQFFFNLLWCQIVELMEL